MILTVVVSLITLANPRNLFQVVPDEIKRTWNDWALRALILISLALQITLSVLGKLRKYNPTTLLSIATWFFYILASTVVSAALGMLCYTFLPVQTTTSLMLFWAPFLLLHLGGSDMITAFSSEDNELWLRHFVEIVFQSGIALYILYSSYVLDSRLWELSLLVYLAGFIKCFERIQALRLANTENLRHSMIAPNYDNRFIKGNSQGSFDVNLKEVAEPLLPSNKIVSEAYHLFQTFKGLFVDLILTFEDRDRSQSYFRHLQSFDAFHIVEIELGFAYDMLYTKSCVVYTFCGLLLRLHAILLLLLAPVGFFLLCDLDDYRSIDVAITYLLLAQAVSMEIFAVITMLHSDWIDHWFAQHDLSPNILTFINFPKQPTKRRWSGSFAQLDLLSVALEEKPASFLQTQKFFGIDNIILKHRYKTYTNVSNNLKDLICSQFREFMDLNPDPKALCTHKGSFSLQKNGCDSLLWTITKMEFDQSILIWHIATSLCYYSDHDHKDQVDIDVYRVESKHMSDYLLYLLVSYPVMFPVGIRMIRFRDTCAEAIRFFKEKGPVNGKTEASRKLLEVDSNEVLPSKIKGDRYKSALFDGCRLASTLKKIEKERMWKVISEVWIEILAYVATHCRGFHHEQQLRKGGEFLTHVWLLMAHLGITEQFQVSRGHARVKTNNAKA